MTRAPRARPSRSSVAANGEALQPIAAKFATLRATGRKALIPYLMSGFPSRRQFVEMLVAALDCGADLVEIGAPFSDPLADGPVIQAAGHRSLQQGTTLRTTLEDVERPLASRIDVPALLMSYVNPMRALGFDELASQCARAGIRGWIVPDRDLEDFGELLDPAARHDLDVVPLLAPTTPQERMGKVLRGASGFVYLVSLTGVTGARKNLSLDVKKYAQAVRRHTSLPLCVGFGIASGEQAREATRFTDGVIVGSALLEPFLHDPYPAALRKMTSLLREIRQALDRNDRSSTNDR